MPHPQRVSWPKVGEGSFELRPLRAGLTALIFLKDSFAAGLDQRVTLEVHVVVQHRNACVAYLHVRIIAQHPYPTNSFPDILSLQERSGYDCLMKGSNQI